MATSLAVLQQVADPQAQTAPQGSSMDVLSQVASQQAVQQVNSPPTEETSPYEADSELFGGHPNDDGKPGVLGTIGSDLVSGGKNLFDFAKEYVQHAHPFDPENPVAKALSAQWDSSMQAKQRMMESAKKGDTLGVIQHAAGIVPVASQVDQAMVNYEANPSHENLAHIISSALPAFIPGALRGVGKAAGALGDVGETAAPTAEASAASEASVAPPAEASKPGLIQQVTKGEAVAQPPAQEAIRSGVQASAEAAGTADESMAANIKNQPLVDGHTTVVDEHLSSLKDNESAAYKQVDDAVGFDLKAEKEQLANDQYKLKQLGNTDADVTQRGNLIDAINDSTDRISKANETLRQSGIDPDAPDVIHRQRMAGVDFKKSLIKNTNAADGSVNIRGLLSDSKNLRFTKYGDRLEQFFGSKDSADAFVQHLQEADKMGAHAMRTQKIAKWVAGALGLSAATEAANLAFGK